MTEEEKTETKTETNKISLSNTAKNLVRHIDKSIKDAEAALKGRKIRAIKLNINKPGVRELATVLDIENTPCTLCGAIATVDRFPEAYSQYYYILIPKGVAEEVEDVTSSIPRIEIVRLKHYDLSIIEDDEKENGK